MAISKMKKLTVSIMSNVRDQLLQELQVLGSVHVDVFDDLTESQDQETQNSWAQQLNTVTLDSSLLEDSRKELSGALHKIEELFNVKAPSFEVTTSDVLQNISSKYNIAEVSQNLNILDRQTKESETALNQLQTELEFVQRWAQVIDDMDPIHGHSHSLRGVAGYLSAAEFSQMVASLTDVSELVDVITAWDQNKEIYAYIVAHPSVWDQVSTVLRDFSFNTVQITKRIGRMSDVIYSLEQEIQKNQNIYDQSLRQWESYSHKVTDLALLHDFLEIQIQQQKASSLALTTEQVSFLRVWVPQDYMPKVEAILSIHQKSIDVVVEDPTEEEYHTVPVLLKNNNLTRPFSALTTMYGTPMYGQTVDPTPHLSIFYFIYYGMCLGDALYGTVLALFSAVMMFKNRANQSMSNFYALLTWSGVSAMVAGVFFGSYAGDLLSTYIPVPALTDLRFTFGDGASFFDKPLFVLFVSLVLGAIQLWYGYFIKFVVSLKRTGVQAFFNEFPWLVLLAGFFLWATLVWIAELAGLNLVSESEVSLFFLLMKVGAGLIILNNVRMGFQKGIVAGVFAPLAGAWELYGLSGYLSNLLSYARLLALGLSSGIIANVFNQLSYGIIETTSAINPILGILGVAMLVFLHLFNLVLGGFGAFVHALRLQFVEFFGQFIEGGGKDFSPLICRGKHYTVK